MHGAPALLFVCTTCARHAPGNAGQAGRALCDALRAAIAADALPLEVREVACLNGCPAPCNVGLRGHRRWTYRYSRCTLADVGALLATAARYWAHPRGQLAPTTLPGGLADKLSVAVPPPG